MFTLEIKKLLLRFQLVLRKLGREGGGSSGGGGWNSVGHHSKVSCSLLRQTLHLESYRSTTTLSPSLIIDMDGNIIFHFYLSYVSVNNAIICTI